MPAWIALLANRYHDVEGLFELCRLNSDRSLALGSLLDLALYDGTRAKGESDSADYELPDLGQVKMKGKPGTRQMTVMALAGHNGVSHNHNDVGSFIVYREGKMWLVDPGAPMYTKQTFSPRRYEIIYCGSRGHSVPVIDGKEQREGARYFATLETENLNGEGTKRAVLDMTRAYPRGTVSRLLRTLELNPDANRLELRDEYAFKGKAKPVEEAFITFETATVSKDKQSVRIGSKPRGIGIRALDTPGSFSVEVLQEESDAHRRTDDIVTRITFRPTRPSREMTLAFRIG